MVAAALGASITLVAMLIITYLTGDAFRWLDTLTPAQLTALRVILILVQIGVLIALAIRKRNTDATDDTERHIKKQR